MDLTAIAYQGWLVEGAIGDDDPQMDDLLAAVKAEVVKGGVSAREATFATTWQPGLVAQVFWCDGCHIVPAEHPEGLDDPQPGCAARPVTLVNIAPPLTPEMIAAREAKDAAEHAAELEAAAARSRADAEERPQDDVQVGSVQVES